MPTPGMPALHKAAHTQQDTQCIHSDTSMMDDACRSGCFSVVPWCMSALCSEVSSQADGVGTIDTSHLKHLAKQLQPSTIEPFIVNQLWKACSIKSLVLSTVSLSVSRSLSLSLSVDHCYLCCIHGGWSLSKNQDNLSQSQRCGIRHFLFYSHLLTCKWDRNNLKICGLVGGARV
jgi:hypothetical protein